jgi:MFS family permease
MGVVSGIGCGLGYIAPVSTLVRWFPDRRGMATGMAIMGFGGGAFVAGYLNVALIARVGIATAVMLLGACYLLLMLVGAQLLRRPPDGWAPPATRSSRASAPVSGFAATAPVLDGLTRNQAIRTPQFALLWAMLAINVTAGIGILAQASPMMQDLFGRSPAEAAAVVSIISLFNAGGRFVWASASDWIGRRNTYLCFFVLQVALFLAIPRLAAAGAWWPFQLTLFAIFTMYGGGFATIPAYLADVFGTRFVGAIHGAVLTAWSVAAVAGPLLITELSARGRAAVGGDATRAYDLPLQLLAGLLALGALLTLFVRPVRGEVETA